MKYYLAIDIGASSGRHIVGRMEDGVLKTDEVFRFPNGMMKQGGSLVWDLDALVGYVKQGIDRALEKYPRIESLSVDTWGVDYVLMRGEKEILPCYAYRDSRTESAIPAVHEIMPFAELYRRTGIQFQTFNTVYQLYADKLAGRLDDATDFLLMPEYLLYRLCGAKSHEYTMATTGGMVNAQSRQYDTEIVRALDLPEKLFHFLSLPGTVIGEYKGIRCMLCASHDTASAVEGIPGLKEDDLYLSSGTWSLLGARLETPVTSPAALEGNWTNEGGVGCIRFLKNIMGMWIVNRLREELCPDTPFGEIVRMAEESGYDGTVDVNDPSLMAPESMKAAFDTLTGHTAIVPGDYFRCAYRSLAKCYGDTIRNIALVTGRTFRRLVIVGGGAKNTFLNRLTAEAAGIEVVPLPIEATAMGNLNVQIRNQEKTEKRL